MNTSLFIAKHIAKGKDKKSIARPIINIAIAGITISLTVMILSLSIVLGFQKEIREKVIGFGSHIQVVSFQGNISYKSDPIVNDQSIFEGIKEKAGVKHIQTFAIHPVIFQVNNQVEGVVAKGISNDFDWSFFEDNLIEGEIIEFNDSSASNQIVLSSVHSNRLELKVGDTLPTFFIRDAERQPKAKELIVKGIYETGLTDFDEKYALVDLKYIQDVNTWGLEVYLKLEKECYNDSLTIKALAFGGNKKYFFKWGDSEFLSAISKIRIKPNKDTVIRVIAYDFEELNSNNKSTIPDTAYLKITKKDIGATDCWENYSTELSTTEGSGKYYIGGFELLVKDFNQLDDLENIVYRYIPEDLDARSIKRVFPEVFNWLKVLDKNVYLLIVLMLIVGVVNMISALLVLILERTNMIGVLKAVGMTNWNVRKIFVYNAFFILLRGLIFGNIVGIGLALLQKYFMIIKLPSGSYFMDNVPIQFDWMWITMINIGTVVFCILILLLPTYLVTKISPVKAIKFE